MIIKRFRRSILWQDEEKLLTQRLQNEVSLIIKGVRIEHCFYIDSNRPLTSEESGKLDWILSASFEQENFGAESGLTGLVFEVGPRPEITTPFSTNIVKICQSCGLPSISRVEKSRRYEVQLEADSGLAENQKDRIYSLLYDRMTEAPYFHPLETFESGKNPEPVKLVPVLEKSVAALEEFGFPCDPALLQHIADYFVKLGVNPTDVLCRQLMEMDSDHSRHRRFQGLIIIDGEKKGKTLLEVIKANYRRNPGQSLVAFDANSSVIKGHGGVPVLVSADPTGPSKMIIKKIKMEEAAKCESHNHPTAICSIPGAATGTGGWIRDFFSLFGGALPVACSTLYLTGYYRIPGYVLPWETTIWEHPYQLETGLQIIQGAPAGAYRYGNEYGLPTISGSTTAFEYLHRFGKEVELFGYTKCGMWVTGMGWIERQQIRRKKPKAGLLIVQLGGDAYPIGLGGASGSSKTLGTQAAELDWNSVQRANAEMEKCVADVVRSCITLGKRNPIWDSNDLGAGGDGNAVTELIYPAGGKVYLRSIPSGDKTMSKLVLWCNESQERMVFLVPPEELALLQGIARREKCPMAIIGEITGDGRLVLIDEEAPVNTPEYEKVPVDLDLNFGLGEIPQLVIEDKRIERELHPLQLPEGLTVRETLEKVLRLPKVASKSFLVNHVDRSVGGLIAQQQNVGPLQLPLADVAVAADSHFAKTGKCWGIGDQPIKWIVNPAASLRLAVAEALTNLVWAPVENFARISLLGNWGVAASEPGEMARLFDANEELNIFLGELGISINGGKDSMSMAVEVDWQNTSQMVKVPGTLVVTAYAACPNITKITTPDIKRPGESKLMFIDLSGGQYRLGGSALAQVLQQIGDESPDVDAPQLFRRGFEVIQALNWQNLILAGHDRSDGGLIGCLVETAFAGNCGVDINFPAMPNNPSIFPLLFAEESGMVIEYSPEKEKQIQFILSICGLNGCAWVIGQTTTEKKINIWYNHQLVLSEDMRVLRHIWQEASYQIERLQGNPKCAEAEKKANYDRPGLHFDLTFGPKATSKKALRAKKKPKVAILREEGTNGDGEMAAAFQLAGAEAWNIPMTDLIEGKIGLDPFKGIVFCGGFSYGDHPEAGKGWAATILFNERVRQEFETFYNRPDTFSLGICNGCQVMPLLGWIPWQGIELNRQPRLVFNNSWMFESRFLAGKIMPSPSIFLRGMKSSILGLIAANGEGRFFFPDPLLLEEIERQNLVAIRYVDDLGSVTEDYPFNPSNSPRGIIAITSPNGRHLACMLHPERLFQKWQWPWMPEKWKIALEASPWLKFFQNAIEWCNNQKPAQ